MIAAGWLSAFGSNGGSESEIEPWLFIPISTSNSATTIRKTVLKTSFVLIIKNSPDAKEYPRPRQPIDRTTTSRAGEHPVQFQNPQSDDLPGIKSSHNIISANLDLP